MCVSESFDRSDDRNSIWRADGIPSWFIFIDFDSVTW
jgi:hypothetical protein